MLARAGIDASVSEGSRGTEANRMWPGHGRDRRAPGHGRHGAQAYDGAHRTEVPHPRMTHGDRCPACTKGKVYRQREPGVLIRLVGQAPMTASVYALEKLRCNLCGELFTADPPPGVGTEKYDATTGAMVTLLTYGRGMPFYRLEQRQANLQIPLPASTQWEMVADTAERIRPAWDALTHRLPLLQPSG